MSEDKVEHLLLRWKDLRDRGKPASSEELCVDCPELLPLLRQRLDAFAQATPAETAPDRAPQPSVHKEVMVPNPAARLEAEQCDGLRRRLRLVTLIYLIQWVIIFNSMILAGERLEQPIAAVPELLILPLSAVVLTRKQNWSLRLLRGLEAVIFSSVIVRVGFGQGTALAGGLLSQVLESGDVVKLTLLADGLSFPWFVLIAIYGVFVPNRWQRCAPIIGGMFLLPFAMVLGFMYLEGILGAPPIHNFLTRIFLRLALAVTIALYGCYRIEQLRGQIAEARKLGPYILKRCLGKGGMGEVHLAEHQLLRRACAVKLIRSDKVSTAHDLQRFEREVQALANLSHANIVEVFDYGMATDGTFYYVMEYLPGLTLREMVECFGPLPPSRATHFLRQIAAALETAHARGLIHRDIKPANVIVCEKGGVKDLVKLLDFGLVQVCHGPSDSRLTQDGGVVGTPAFMSPEQIAGAHTLDARSDIYSVGVLAYFLLTGRNPFDRMEVRQIFAAHLQDTAPRLRAAMPGIDEDLEEVVHRCLAKEPGERFADAGALEKALGACRCAAGWSPAEAHARWREHKPAAS